MCVMARREKRRFSIPVCRGYQEEDAAKSSRVIVNERAKNNLHDREFFFRASERGALMSNLAKKPFDLKKETESPFGRPRGPLGGRPKGGGVAKPTPYDFVRNSNLDYPLGRPVRPAMQGNLIRVGLGLGAP